MSTAYLGLGANLGDRALQLLAAVQLLDGPLVRVTRVSSVYETAPVGPIVDQPLFYNAVAELSCRLEPWALLQHGLAVEAQLGRHRAREKGPRLIDIDVLLYEAEVINGSELELPHAELTARRFVLVPLLELCPELVDPRDGRALAHTLDLLDAHAARETRETRGAPDTFECRGDLMALAAAERAQRLAC